MHPSALDLRPPDRRVRAPVVAAIVAAVIVAVVLLRVVVGAIEVPRTVDEITIANATDYGVDVVVRAPDAGSVLPLARALPQQETSRQLVLDQGDRWVFIFERSGVRGGAIELSREQLESASWSVDVPPQVAQTFADEGIVPYAREGSGR